MAQDSVLWGALVNTVLNFRVYKRRGISWKPELLLDFLRRILLHGIRFALHLCEHLSNVMLQSCHTNSQKDMKIGRFKGTRLNGKNRHISIKFSVLFSRNFVDMNLSQYMARSCSAVKRMTWIRGNLRTECRPLK